MTYSCEENSLLHDQLCSLEALLSTQEGMFDLCKITNDIRYEPEFLSQLGWTFLYCEMDEICPEQYTFRFQTNTKYDLEVYVEIRDDCPPTLMDMVIFNRSNEENEQMAQ